VPKPFLSVPNDGAAAEPESTIDQTQVKIISIFFNYTWDKKIGKCIFVPAVGLLRTEEACLAWENKRGFGTGYLMWGSLENS